MQPITGHSRGQGEVLMSTRQRVALVATAAVALGGTVLVGPADASRRPTETEFVVTIENISDGFEFSQSGVFTNPDGSDTPGPAFPGSSYQFEVFANPGDHLSLATMLVQSNDWFFSPLEDGIALYDDDGNPLNGDITDQFAVLDAGTEIDQIPGEGEDQAPRQSGPNTGADDPDSAVRPAEGAPVASDLIKVMSESAGDGSFMITVLNISDSSDLAGPIAPGVFVVHQGSAPLFDLGQPNRDEGLEALAEDGSPGGLAESLAPRTGVATPLAPGVFAASQRRNLLFHRHRADRGRGLEALAEDGNPADLAMDLASRYPGDNGVFAVPVGSSGPGALLPGESYQFRVTAQNHERLQVATMFVQSNDWFFATRRQGVPLFRRGEPISGDITRFFQLYDAGTEIDQTPGFGADQPPRQAGPNTGADDPDSSVRLVQRDVGSLIRVTISAVDES